MRKFRFHLLGLLFVVLVCEPARSTDVAVMMSGIAEPQRRAFQGFAEVLSHRIVKNYDIKNDPHLGRKILQDIQAKINPGLVFTVGAPALRVVLGKRPELPAVYSMVFNPERIIGPHTQKITGVSIDAPPEETLTILRNLHPNARRVGIIVDSATNAHLLLRAREAARKLGLQLIAREASSPRKGTQALASLRDEIDVLWLLPDESIITQAFLEYALLWSYRNEVPVVGLSAEHTSMGAALSVFSGHSVDMGRQAGEMANMILRGEKPQNVPHRFIRKAKFTVNLKTARKVGIEIPTSILERAANAVPAPVYAEGDWWIFRVKRDGPWSLADEAAATTPQEYRVVYENGGFHSSDPDFLKVSRNLSSISYWPLISLNLPGPEKRWFDFPLIEGKKWAFRYLHTQRGGSSYDPGSKTWRFIEAEVVGPVSSGVATPAGKFSAIEIRRHVDAPKRHTVEFVYFYSPTAKSVVKLVAGIENRWMSRARFGYEMELVAYGHHRAGMIPLAKE